MKLKVSNDISFIKNCVKIGQVIENKGGKQGHTKIVWSSHKQN